MPGHALATYHACVHVACATGAEAFPVRTVSNRHVFSAERMSSVGQTYLHKSKNQSPAMIHGRFGGHRRAQMHTNKRMLLRLSKSRTKRNLGSIVITIHLIVSLPNLSLEVPADLPHHLRPSQHNPTSVFQCEHSESSPFALSCARQ